MSGMTFFALHSFHGDALGMGGFTKPNGGLKLLADWVLALKWHIGNDAMHITML